MRSLILAMLLSPAIAGAAESMCLERPIRYAHYEFGLLYSEGSGGIDEDIRAELERRSGCRFKVVLQPRARTWLEIETGALDMAGSGIETPVRDRFAWFAHYVLENNVVVIGPRVPTGMHGMAEFIATPGLRLGGVRSFRYSPFYDQAVDELVRQGRFAQEADSNAVHRLFERQLIDGFIASNFLTQFRLLKTAEPPRMEDWDPADPSPSGLVLSKRSFSPEQAQHWQTLVQQMLDDGTVLRIVTARLGDRRLAEAAVYARRTVASSTSRP